MAGALSTSSPPPASSPTWNTSGRNRASRITSSGSRPSPASSPSTSAAPGSQTGMSATLEARMDDIRAVMDAAGAKRAAILGVSEGGPMAAMFAATYPERTRALVLYGAFAEFSSWVPTPEQYRAVEDYIDQAWG